MNRVKSIWALLIYLMALPLSSRAVPRHGGNMPAQITPAQSAKEASASLTQKGFAELRTGPSREAMNTFEEAKRIDPFNSIVRFGLARSLQDEDLKIRALEEYTISIFLDPGHAKAYANRALVKGSLQDLAGALDDLQAAIKLDGGLAAAYLGLPE